MRRVVRVFRFPPPSQQLLEKQAQLWCALAFREFLILCDFQARLGTPRQRSDTAPQKGLSILASTPTLEHGNHPQPKTSHPYSYVHNKQRYCFAEVME